MDARPDPDLAAGAGEERWTAERVLELRAWTPRQLSFRTTRSPSFRFTPGHYARLGLDGSDGETVWRPYSVVSAAYDDYLEFLAILVPEGAFSVGLERLRVGDTALEAASECSFTARKLECEPSPFFACFCRAAIGIASPSLATLSHNL
mgnify:CR=1 FL=1